MRRNLLFVHTCFVHVAYTGFINFLKFCFFSYITIHFYNSVFNKCAQEIIIRATQ